MKNLSWLLTGALVLASPGLALAQNVEGPYVGVAAGGGWNSNADLKGPYQGSLVKDTIHYQPATADEFELGYDFGNGVRAEANGLYRDGAVDKTKGPGSFVYVPGRSNFGYLRGAGAFGNVFYDYDTGSNWTPFVGGGVGALWLVPYHVGVVQGTTFDSTESTFAYQASLGLGYKVTPELTLAAQYKYVSAPESIKFTLATGGRTKMDDYQNNAVMIALRYTFGEEAAPPPTPAPEPVPATQAPVATPAPAPAPQPYLVFFDFNKSRLSKDAKAVVDTAAAAAKAGNPAQIIATGHTDTVGTVKYNQALSVRRAKAVKAELVKQGIPAKEIEIIGKGKSEPRVPTADQVREPQNRRVEIVLK